MIQEHLIPKNIEEAVNILYYEVLTSQELIDMGAMPKSDMVKWHSTLGREIRNNWGLSQQQGPLYDYLKALGLNHSDDMSALIFHFLWKKIHKQPWDDLEEQIRAYEAYWEDVPF